jgi:hypothetical protein
MLSVVWDNVIRARFGQFVYKDQVLLYSTFSFWFSLENYARLIVIGFCFHCLSPLELELLELVEVYSALQQWCTVSLLPITLLLATIMLSVTLLNYAGNWLNVWSLFLILTVTVMLVAGLLCMLWDFLLTSLTGVMFRGNIATHYNASRSSLAYDMSLFGEDAYDWHIANPGTFVFRFEDLYLFFLQLFNVVALYACSFVWLFFLVDVVRCYTNAGGAAGVYHSFTFLGVCTR